MAPSPVSKPGTLDYGSGGGRDQRGAGRNGVGPNSLGTKPRGRGHGNKRDPLGLFPSTSISQQTLNQLLGSARTQVQQNYAGSALPSEQHYLQPYEDRAADNLRLADAAKGYLQAASANAQNISGAFTSALQAGMQAGQQATLGAGGSGLPGAIPPAPVGALGAQMVGSSWTNYLNALAPAQATRAQEATDATRGDENRAIADYHKAQATRTTDMQTAIQTLYKSNLDTLRAAKDSDYRNALSLYAILGKAKYEKLLLKQRAHEFDVHSGQVDRGLDQGDTKITNTEAYRQSSLDIQRHKAAKETGIDTLPALKILNSGKGVAAAGVKTGPVGQLGRTYYVADVLYSAADSPTHRPIFNTKNPRKINIDYGKPVPTGKDAKGNVIAQVSPGAYYFPKAQPGAQNGPTAESYQQAVRWLKGRYGAKITPKWLATYFPPPPPVA